METRSRRRRLGTRLAVLATLATLAAAAGCGSSSPGSSGSSGSKSGGSLVLDVFAPFSGSEADYGKHGIEPGVLAGMYAVNKAGGVLGHQFTIMTTDSTGDAADAIPNADELVATHGNSIATIFGLDSNTSNETTRIFNAAKIPTFTASGTVQLNNVSQYYVYRPYPPDNVESYAMAALALAKGYTRAAIVFAEGTGAQENVPYLGPAFKKGGGDIVANVTLPPDESSYSAEIQTVLNSKPQVLFMEADPQTYATFFSNLKSVHSNLIPTIMTSTEPAAIQSIASALGEGPASLGSFLSAAAPQTSNQAVYNKFVADFKQANGGASPFNGYNPVYYDSVIEIALAMTLAGSTQPTAWIPKVDAVSNNEKAPVCTSYPACLTYAKAGKAFRYVGAAGPIYYNQYHWTTGEWALVEPGSAGQAVPVGRVSGAAVAQVS